MQRPWPSSHAVGRISLDDADGCHMLMLMLICWFADTGMLMLICWYMLIRLCWYAQVGAGDKFKPFLRWCQNCLWDNCQVSSVKNCFWEESFHTHGTLSWEGDSWKLPRVSAKCWTSTCWNTTRNLRTYLKTHSGEKSNKCNQCDYASAQPGHLRRHLKIHC